MKSEPVAILLGLLAEVSSQDTGTLEIKFLD